MKSEILPQLDFGDWMYVWIVKHSPENTPKIHPCLSYNSQSNNYNLKTQCTAPLT